MINANRVTEIFMACLFAEGEDTTNHVPAEGIVNSVGFHPTRLETHAEEVKSMLDELPTAFHKSGGGGWSFLQACNDRNDEQWTGTHQVMEQLFQLGIGIKCVTLLAPREMWSMLPGGMPYYIVDTTSPASADETGIMTEQLN
jgi:hypothetical protein